MPEHILSISYGKDSLACLGAIEKLGLPLDRIIHAEVWATDTIPADLPPMVEFKAKADKIIKDRWGIDVERFCAMDKLGNKRTYDSEFYHKVSPRREMERKEKVLNFKYYADRPIYGFPITLGAWCNSRLKVNPLQRIRPNKRELVQLDTKNGSNKGKQNAIGIVQYVGIAEDEPERLERLDGEKTISPLHLIGWSEADAKQWCIENDLLSPIYTDTCLRGGCWFCHNQGTQQLRELRQNYPPLWELMLKWDSDSPVTFKADGHTVHDFDKRFALEDEGLISPMTRILGGVGLTTHHQDSLICLAVVKCLRNRANCPKIAY